MMLKFSAFVVLLVCCYIESVESVEAREVLRARLAMKRNSLKVMESKVLDAKIDANDGVSVGGGEGVGVLEAVSNDKVNSPSDQHQMELIEEHASESQHPAPLTAAPIPHEQFPSLLESVTAVKQREGSESHNSITDLNGKPVEVEIQSSKSTIKENEMEKEELDPELIEQIAAEAQVGGCAPLIPRTCPDGSSFKDFKLSSTSSGCGRSLPNNLVVDSLKNGALTSKFSPCCETHYSCYSQFRSNKDDCDHAFYRCMLDKCVGWWCKTKAYGYYLAVSENGCEIFESTQRDHGCKYNI